MCVCVCVCERERERESESESAPAPAALGNWKSTQLGAFSAGQELLSFPRKPDFYYMSIGMEPSDSPW